MHIVSFFFGMIEQVSGEWRVGARGGSNKKKWRCKRPWLTAYGISKKVMWDGLGFPSLLLFCYLFIYPFLLSFRFSPLPFSLRQPHRPLSFHQQHLPFIQHSSFSYFLHSSDSHSTFEQTNNRVREEVRRWAVKNTKHEQGTRKKGKTLL
jgi:hypothetical protein